MTETGKAAPAFNAPASGGEHLALEDLMGNTVVLYFYPKDDTPGCTKEATAFTERLADFSQAGAIVVGISKDSTAKHDRFITKHGLKVRLVSDENGTICEAYGVWVEKSMYGRNYMGIERATFLIDATGKIRKIWRKVKVPGHAEEVLAAARELKAQG